MAKLLTFWDYIFSRERAERARNGGGSENGTWMSKRSFSSRPTTRWSKDTDEDLEAFESINPVMFSWKAPENSYVTKIEDGIPVFKKDGKKIEVPTVITSWTSVGYDNESLSGQGGIKRRPGGGLPQERRLSISCWLRSPGQHLLHVSHFVCQNGMIS